MIGMVEQSDLGKINSLNGELRQIDLALDIFANDGRIVSLTVASAINDPMARTTMVNTADMAYPPQMVEAIKEFLDQREQGIRDELTNLGITGVDEPKPRSVKGAKT